MNSTARTKPPLPRSRVRPRFGPVPPPLPCDQGFAAKLFAEVDRFDAPRSELEARAQFAPAHALPKASCPTDLSLVERVIITLPPPPLPPRHELDQATLPPLARTRRLPSRWARSVALVVVASVLLGLATLPW